MGQRCQTDEYFDYLLSSCQPCVLRCPKPPPDCLKFSTCSRSSNFLVLRKEVPSTSAGTSIIYKTEGSTNFPVTHKEVPSTSAGTSIIYKTEGSTNFPVTHKEVPSTSVGASIIYKTEDSGGTSIEKDPNYVIWILVVLIVVLISTIVIVTFMLHIKRKLDAGSFGKTHGDITTKSSVQGADLEQASCDELKKPVAENEDVNNLAGVSAYNNVLSDYLFPLPAVEEGAAILVTTKTSACFSADPGVTDDAFVEM